MPGALVGVVSCARCGAMQTSPDVLCESCGMALTPAAQGSVLGTYTPLLAGVARASAARGNLAVLIDALPLAVAAAVAVVQAASGQFGRLIWTGVLGGVFVAVQLLLFVLRGRTVGRLALSLRTVDDLTGNPVSVRKIIERLTTAYWVRRTVTADLRRGRDPLTRADLAIHGDDLKELGIQGPRIGETLATLLDRVLDDPTLNTRESLLAIARKSR